MIEEPQLQSGRLRLGSRKCRWGVGRLIMPALATLGPCVSLAGAERVGTQSTFSTPFPVVIRLSENLFRSTEPQVDETTRVDTCVLGIRNTGHAEVHGEILPDFVPGEREANLDLVFRGTTTSATSGSQGPATIHSTTQCRFELRAPIVFDEEKGFAAGDPKSDLHIERMHRRVQTSSPGLRGRLVKRVAHRRLREKDPLIRAIAKENTESRLTDSMDKRIEERLVVWNENWRNLRAALQQQQWYTEVPKLSFVTDDHHLFICVARGNAAATKPADAGFRVDALPAADPTSLAEILILTEWVRGERDAAAILTYLAAMGEPLLIVAGDVDGVRVDSDQDGDWSIFRIRAETQAPLPAP